MERVWRNVVRKLFVAATELLEDNHAVAAGGQDARASVAEYLVSAKRLRVSAQQLMALADALIVILEQHTSAQEREPDPSE